MDWSSAKVTVFPMTVLPPVLASQVDQSLFGVEDAPRRVVVRRWLLVGRLAIPAPQLGWLDWHRQVVVMATDLFGERAWPTIRPVVASMSSSATRRRVPVAMLRRGHGTPSTTTAPTRRGLSPAVP